jgi:hypothetical protein
MEGVVEAADRAGLPQDYIQFLKSWLPKSQASTRPFERPKVQPLWSAPSGTLRKSREV